VSKCACSTWGHITRNWSGRRPGFVEERFRVELTWLREHQRRAAAQFQCWAANERSTPGVVRRLTAGYFVAAILLAASTPIASGIRTSGFGLRRVEDP
jgi:hypothetical protein